jgi:hypothetical protein
LQLACFDSFFSGFKYVRGTSDRRCQAACHQRVYFMTLVLSFVFLIGPSLQSVMSAIIGLMHGPHGY